MKDKRYSNRGGLFEEYIRYANERYKRNNVAVICKIPTEFIPIRNAYGQLVSCKVESKSSVDFIGRYKNISTAIEAKHTSTDSIKFSEVKHHQAMFLESYKANEYGFSGVLVSFKMDRFFLVPWPFWEAARSAWENRKDLKGRKADKLTVKGYGVTWITPGKASVKADELLPEWEIKTDRRYGLPYLSKIEQYIKDIEIYGKL